MYRPYVRQERMTRGGGRGGGEIEGEWGGGGEGGSRNIYKLKVMRGGRSTPSFVLAGEDYFTLSRQPLSKWTRMERYWQSSPHKAFDKFHRQSST